METGAEKATFEGSAILCLIALRGYKKPSSTPAKIETSDIDMRAEGNCYILLRIIDVMYRCLKEELIYFEDCVDILYFDTSFN